MIETAYELENEYRRKHPEGHFFDPGTLKFFGERMSEMRLLKHTEEVTDISGEKHTCYVLSSIQHKHPVTPHIRIYHYFDVETLDHVIVD